MLTSPVAAAISSRESAPAVPGRVSPAPASAAAAALKEAAARHQGASGLHGESVESGIPGHRMVLLTRVVDRTRSDAFGGRCVEPAALPAGERIIQRREGGASATPGRGRLRGRLLRRPFRGRTHRGRTRWPCPSHRARAWRGAGRWRGRRESEAGWRWEEADTIAVSGNPESPVPGTAIAPARPFQPRSILCRQSPVQPGEEPFVTFVCAGW